MDEKLNGKKFKGKKDSTEEQSAENRENAIKGLAAMIKIMPPPISVKHPNQPKSDGARTPFHSPQQSPRDVEGHTGGENPNSPPVKPYPRNKK
jgi:hypothetical protein